ncbi:non-ribosomal peptide synthetase [Xenorhabdus nematophila]|uniref:non-ribosomal peptide synthetase n=1 Tax=Xenorhabdus nematophila TaxID=628 RepID=UPI001E4F4BAF|nr:AMP-binding protein [Xenorhabdus nematophila]
MIYTSGSTGTPKGVMVEHRNILRLFEATEDGDHFNHQDIWCLFHSIAFDFSVWELWGALRYGAKLVLVAPEIARSPQELHQFVCRHGITVLNQTPSAFKAFIASYINNPLPDQLRYVIFGGESLDPGILRPWYRMRGETSPRLVNMYGITETTVHVTYRELNQHDAEQITSPIGKRIPDLTLYLLGNEGQPVPLGAVGELYIGDAGVAQGYLNRPDLTAERFLADPFSHQPAARIYRTGDLARYLPNGKLDRGSLPAADNDAFAREVYAAPQGETEIVLVAIWRDLLGIEHISRHDNFFTLGGHSLLAVRMMDLGSATAFR